MNSRLMMSSCAIAVVMAGTAAVAQQTTPSQPVDRGGSRTQTTTQTTAQNNRGADNRVTFVGCVQSRSAYMQSQGTAQGTAGSRVGNNVAGGNDFVLIQATPSTSASLSVEPGGTVGLSASTPAPSVEAGAQAGVSAPQSGTQAGEVSIEARANSGSGTAVGSGTSVGTSGSMSTYGLTGHAAELRTHVGKRVEIVGTMARANATANASPNARTSAGASGDMQMLTVVSVREVTGSCPAQ
jgi:hypothetical protein